MSPFLLYIIQKLFPIFPDTHCFGIKRFLLRLSGAKIGKNVRICSSVTIIGDNKLSIGDNTWIGHNCMIICSAPIHIGKNVNIAPRCYIGSGTHEINYSGDSIAGKGKSCPICIEDGVWVCTHSILLPGVVIGSHSIVAAGAVILNNIPSFELWGGIPAKYIRKLS